MSDPTPWEKFQVAVASNDEGNIRQSFEALYKDAKHGMVRFAGWCVHKHRSDPIPGYVLDAEEVVEDAFAELFRNCKSINKDPRRWILGTIKCIVRYQVARAWRECKKQQAVQGQLDESRRPRGTRCSLSHARRSAVRNAVRSLPVRMRAVIIALIYRDESVATAATQLGISENAVIQARRRALKKLEELLAH